MSGTIWSKFFWSDWESDTALRMCSLSAQGLWMRLLCVAAQHDPIGYVAVNGRPLDGQDIARVAGVSVPEAESLLQELDRNGVFSRDRNKRVYSRRMVRDAKRSANAVKNGKTGGNPTLGNKRGIFPSDNPPLKSEDKPQEPESRSQIETIPPPPSGAPPLKNSKGVPLPFEAMPDGWRYLAVEMGHEDPDGEFQKLKDWCAFVTPKSKALKRDWKAFWRNWIRKSVDDNRKRTGGSNNSHKRGWIDAAIAVGAKIEDPPDVFG